MAKSARARSTCAAGALSERLRRGSSWRSSAVSGRRGAFRWRDMAHLGARGSPHHYTSSPGRRPTSELVSDERTIRIERTDNESCDRRTDELKVEDGDVAFNKATFVQLLEPFRDRASGCNAVAYGFGRQVTVGLKFDENSCV